MPVNTCLHPCAVFALGSEVQTEDMLGMRIKQIERQEPPAFTARFFGFRKPAFGLSTAIGKIVVISRMIGSVRDLKVLKPVVQLVSVFMMDNLGTLKFSAKVLFDNKTVFKNIMSVNTKRFIPLTKPSFAFTNIIWIAVKEPSEIVFVAVSTGLRSFLAILNRAFHVTNIHQQISKVKKGYNYGLY
jgi:hypothetical protein